MIIVYPDVRWNNIGPLGGQKFLDLLQSSNSLPELDGIRLGGFSAAVLSEWLEEDALMEVLEVAEELLEAEDLTAAPRVKDCSLRV